MLDFISDHSGQKLDEDDEDIDDDEELTQEDTWSVVSAFFDEFQMVRKTIERRRRRRNITHIYIGKTTTELI